MNEDRSSVAAAEYARAAYEVEIPAYIDGYTVMAIEDGAFYLNASLTSVIIPDELLVQTAVRLLSTRT